MRYFIELSYNGKAYHGWQYQPNAITVQEILENALSKLLKSKIAVVGAGRTDAGVHALQMFAHFDIDQELEREQLLFKLNAFLPKNIVINTISRVTDDAHARFDASSRTYIYKINTKKNVFTVGQSVYIKHDLDVTKLKEASSILLDYKNFKCFSRSNTDVKTYNCDITFTEWRMIDNELIFTIQADRFLRNMVRAVVGTLLDIASGKLNVDKLHEIIKSEDRGQAGASAPAHGLYLSKIEYPKHLFIDG